MAVGIVWCTRPYILIQHYNSTVIPLQLGPPCLTHTNMYTQIYRQTHTHTQKHRQLLAGNTISSVSRVKNLSDPGVSLLSGV